MRFEKSFLGIAVEKRLAVGMAAKKVVRVSRASFERRGVVVYA